MTGWVVALLFVARFFQFEVPNPGVIFALAIVYSSFANGVRIGLLSAALALFGAVLYILSNGSIGASPEETNLTQLLILAVCLPTMALLVGRLRSQLLTLALEQEAVRAKQAAETKYRRLVDSIRDYAILMLDPQGIIRSWNEGAQRLTGYRSDEILGRHLSVFYSPEDRAAGKAELELSTATESGRFVDEGWRVRKDGSRYWANVVLSAIRDPATNELQGFVKVTRDLSERKRADEELRQKSIALEASNKELEAFSYSVSHDLRAPLRGIDGFSQALLEDYKDRLDEEGRDYLKRIRAGTQRMGHLIDDLLNLSRLTRGEMSIQSVDLSSLAQRVFQELQAAEPERKVRVSIQGGLRAQGDPGLLNAALQNLISNAWKFTSKRVDARIEFGQNELDGAPVYYVRDNGAGFDMAYADKLFGAFQRLHRTDEFSGSGVGLATVRRIIHRHGGEIWVEAGVNRGATFYFTLGMAKPQFGRAA